MFSAEQRFRAGATLEQLLEEDAAAIKARIEAKTKAAADRANQAAQAAIENQQPAEPDNGNIICGIFRIV